MMHFLFLISVPLLCAKCGRTQRDKGSRRKHQMNCKASTCNKCLLDFGNADGLESHKKTADDTIIGHKYLFAANLFRLKRLGLQDVVYKVIS
jgi:hypothetical protein